MYSSEILERLGTLAKKIEKLNALGDMRHYSYDMELIQSAVSCGKIELHDSTLATYRQFQDYVVEGSLTVSWTKLILSKQGETITFIITNIYL